MLSLRLQNTLHKKKILFNVFLIVLRQHCTGKNHVQCCLNILGTTLYRKNNFCSVVQMAPDNIAIEKILFSVAVILLGQHCTGKPCAILAKRLQTTLHRKNLSALSSEQHHFSAIFILDTLIF